MITFRAFWVAALICSLNTMAAAQNPLDLLQRVSENYHNLRSFEFGGHLTATIPGTESQIRFGTVNAEAGSDFVPTNSTVLKYGEGFSFREEKITDVEGRPARASFSGLRVNLPAHLGNYEHISVDVKDAKAFLSETLEVGGTPVECDVLVVLYARRLWGPEERRVKYWIDAKRLLVVKEELATVQDLDDTSIVWHWIYKVDSVKLNQPPPGWLIDEELSVSHADHARPEWVGKEAPYFSLLDLDGHKVDLATMRGKVVVLDFWATWCVPCIEEMPIIEKIREAYKEKDVEIWGISLEQSANVKGWMVRERRKLQTVIDRWGKTSEQYHVEGIPSLVVIDRDGKILSYYLGNQSEQSLRAGIDLALQKNPTNNK